MSAPWCPARSATTGRCRTPRAGCRWPELDLHAGRRSAGRRGWTAMHLVLALLGALGAALGARTDLVLENLALRQQLALLRRRSKRALGLAPSIDSSGYGYRSGGRDGARRSMWFAPRR